jgi:hypothetical protein
VLAANQTNPRSIALHNGVVYWANAGTQSTAYDDGSVMSCPASGCPDGPTVIAHDQLESNRVAVDDGGVYWINAHQGVVTCPLGGCPMQGPTQVISVTSVMTKMSSIALHGDNVYFSTFSDGPQAQHPGVIAACARTGCANGPAVIASDFDIAAIAVDNANVYWLSFGTAPSYTDGRVLACPLAGCNDAPTELVTHQNGPWAIATDGEFVYWTDNGTPPTYANSALMKCAVNGCGNAPTTIASGTELFGLAIDDVNAYWTTFFSQLGAVRAHIK